MHSLFKNEKITECKDNVIFLKTKPLHYICILLSLFFSIFKSSHLNYIPITNTEIQLITQTTTNGIRD